MRTVFERKCLIVLNMRVLRTRRTHFLYNSNAFRQIFLLAGCLLNRFDESFIFTAAGRCWPRLKRNQRHNEGQAIPAVNADRSLRLVVALWQPEKLWNR